MIRPGSLVMRSPGNTYGKTASDDPLVIRASGEEHIMLAVRQTQS